MRSPTLVVALGVALAGCGGMMAGTDEMHATINRGMAEDQNHRSAASEIDTMPGMTAEMDRHVLQMASIIDDMTSDMMSMSHCRETSSMMNLREHMRVEVDAHAAAMRGIASVGDARDEVGHHVSAMDTMLHDMDAMLDGMHCGGW